MPNRVGNQLRNVLGVRFTHNVFAVVGNGAFCNVEFVGCLLDAEAFGNPTQDFFLAPREPLVFQVGVVVVGQ